MTKAKTNTDRPHGLRFTEPSLTKQSHRDECNINVIMDKYNQTGVLSHLNGAQPTYGDYSNVESYGDALGIVQRADAHFMSLPSDVRQHFNNDPQQLLDFISDPQNHEKAVELGLASGEGLVRETDAGAPTAPVGDPPPAPAVGDPPVTNEA